MLDDSDKCWDWDGPRNSLGYGVFSHHGKLVRAHRVMYELVNGPINGRWLYVCHQCDRPPCVNPGHLWLGRPADNTADMLKKGRNPWLAGKRNRLSKLDAHKVLDIRRRATANETQRSIAAVHDISVGAVNKIIHRKSWASVR